jgi:hypothetical protein
MWRTALLCVGVCLSLPASAATLNAVQGQVFVNHGKGFQQVASGAEAREGDLIMADPGASANLIYPGGCVTKIEAGNVVTVNDGSKCPKAMLLGEDAECDQIPDPKERDRCWCKQHRDDPTLDRQSYRARCGVVWWPYAAGAAAIGGGVAAAVLLSNNGNSHHHGGGGGGPHP